MHPIPFSRERGFSLLEVLVAFSIMAFSLGVLYQAAGGSVRAAMEAERQTRAALLAQSLLASYPSVPEEGVREEGEHDGLTWRLLSEAWPAIGDPLPPVRLHRIVVEIAWTDRGNKRGLVLTSVVPSLAKAGRAR